jgi:hypothetical protein
LSNALCKAEYEYKYKISLNKEKMTKNGDQMVLDTKNNVGNVDCRWYKPGDG